MSPIWLHKFFVIFNRGRYESLKINLTFIKFRKPKCKRYQLTKKCYEINTLLSCRYGKSIFFRFRSIIICVTRKVDARGVSIRYKGNATSPHRNHWSVLQLQPFSYQLPAVTEDVYQVSQDSSVCTTIEHVARETQRQIPRACFFNLCRSVHCT